MGTVTLCCAKHVTLRIALYPKEKYKPPLTWNQSLFNDNQGKINKWFGHPNLYSLIFL